MSWAIAGDWLAVIGLIFLTTGTASQAWAELARFKSLRRRVLLDEDFAAIGDAPPIIAMALAAAWDADNETWFSRWNLPSWAAPGWVMMLTLYVKVIFRSIVTAPGRLADIRAESDDDAVKLAYFLRLAGVWGILIIGSGLGLAAAVIQLVLAYQYPPAGVVSAFAGRLP
jgi:hypothetical protein